MDFDTFKKDFADKLRYLRNKKKISAREMSLALGQNVNYINYIENGRHLPSMQGFSQSANIWIYSPQSFLKGKKSCPKAVSKKTSKSFHHFPLGS